MIISGVVSEIAVLDVVDDRLTDLAAGGHHAQHEQHGDEARPHDVSVGRPHAFVNVLGRDRRPTRKLAKLLAYRSEPWARAQTFTRQLRAP